MVSARGKQADCRCNTKWHTKLKTLLWSLGLLYTTLLYRFISFLQLTF